MGRAAVVNWRRRYDAFPAPVGGSAMSLEFDGGAVAAWLLANDNTGVTTVLPAASLVVFGAESGARRLPLDDPWLVLADDAEGEDCVSGWSTAGGQWN
ncbi:hypothetical protein ACGFYQ_35305 [Streptomyces sp. NPDC048258]|uniref:hypothetical protein n=1 Tax=Streptomyces sp. NPDC048258 TaxID=3365527 RepID=UPI00371DAAE5